MGVFRLLLLAAFVLVDCAAIAAPKIGVQRVTPTMKQFRVKITKAECDGLHGKILPISSIYCPFTGKACFTADVNGVVSFACYTELPQ